MDWIFDNFQVLIAVAGAIAYWLNQRRRERAGDSADYDGDGIPETPPTVRRLDPNEPDPVEVQRTREIQEEIRRKILERRAGGTPADDAPPPLPVPSASSRMPESAPLGESPRAPRPVAPEPVGELLRRMLDPDAEARAEEERKSRERQLALQEQLREMEEQGRRERAKLARLTSTLQSSLTADRGDGMSGERSREGSLGEVLQDPRGLRRAVLLREVLGAPVGLR